MKQKQIEAIFTHENHLCVVIFSRMGHRCGYVAVEKDSPLYKISYHENLNKPELLSELKQAKIDKRGLLSVFCWNGESTSPEILFNVHGGITYSGGNCYPITRSRQLWWFGFDCAHYDDRKDLDKYYEYFKKKPESYISIMNSGVIRTEEYVAQECKNLAEQIACVESIY